MSLTELAIRAAKPKGKPYKLYDEKGLFLLVKPNAARLWRFKYTHGGVEKLLSFGAYPEVPLKLARERRDEARRQVAAHIDPSAKRHAERSVRADTFAAIAEEWLQTKKGSLSESTWTRDHDQLMKMVAPYLGSRPIAGIEAPELLAVLKRLEKRGIRDTAHRVRAVCGRVFRYAIATGRATRGISADLKGALASAGTNHYSGITEPARVGQLLRAIEGYDGQATTRAALRLAPYLFVRPGELRAAEWSEFDLVGCERRIPAERMKMGEQHIVSLARQAVAILSELRPLTGTGKYVFPAVRSRDRPLSENTMNSALRRLGYTNEEMTGPCRGEIWRDPLRLLPSRESALDSRKLDDEFPGPSTRKRVRRWRDGGDGLLTSGARALPHSVELCTFRKTALMQRVPSNSRSTMFQGADSVRRCSSAADGGGE